MRPILPALALLFALVGPGVAEHCETYSTTPADATMGAPYMSTYYVSGLTCSIFWDWVECGGIWLYEESNGVPGLQRGDEGIDDTCHGSIRADTIVF